MSRSLIKLIDLSLLPAALLVISKIVGLVVAINIFHIPWALQDLPGSIFSVRPAFLPADILTASSYSDLIMYMIMAIGFSIVLILATHFHDTHIKPQLLMKLTNHNLLGLVKSSFDIYHTAVIWITFIWLTSAVVWVDIAMNKTYLWVGLVTVAANIFFSIMILQDVYNEIDMSRKNLGQQEAF